MDSGKGAEERSANQNPVKVTDDEITIADLEIERYGSEHNAGQAADQEH